jgi:hypothetical protein
VLHSCFSDSESDDECDSDEAGAEKGDENHLLNLRRYDSGHEWAWDGGRARERGSMDDEDAERGRKRGVRVVETATATAVRVMVVGRGRAC